MSMSIRLYPLPGGDGDETKVWYPLSLDMGMMMNFFYKDKYEIVKPVPSRSIAIPIYILWYINRSVTYHKFHIFKNYSLSYLLWNNNS